MNTVYIFGKDNAYGVLARDSNNQADFIGTYDSRSNTSIVKRIEDPIESDKQYNEAIKLTMSRGWDLIYTGNRIYG